MCLFSYSHLSFLVRYSIEESAEKTIDLIHKIFSTVETLNPSNDAIAYWQAINALLINSNNIAKELWKDEKVAHLESIVAAKTEALDYLSSERDRIMKLSHEEALRQLIQASKIENKMKVINKIQDNGLFEVVG